MLPPSLARSSQLRPQAVHCVCMGCRRLLQVTMDIKYPNKTPGIVKAIQVGRPAAEGQSASRRAGALCRCRG